MTSELDDRRLLLDGSRIDRVESVAIVEFGQVVHVRHHDLVDHSAQRTRAGLSGERTVGDELERVAESLAALRQFLGKDPA